MPFQYAELPTIEYKEYRPRYQTYDLKTGTFTYYSVDPNEPSLTTDNVQQKDPVAADTPSASDEKNAPEDGSTGELTLGCIVFGCYLCNFPQKIPKTLQPQSLLGLPRTVKKKPRETT